MDTERFDETEAETIFARAAKLEASARQPAAGSGGMTLGELQDIGMQAGLSPEAVARAAASLRSTGTTGPAPTFLRIPVGVAHCVALDRPLSDDEWGSLIAHLRTTFNAGGSIRSEGSFREWKNGNLRIHAGPTPGGYQVDMRTSSSNARTLMTVGGVMAGISAGLLAGGTVTGSMAPGDVADIVPALAAGVALFGAGVLHVQVWARRRRRQFEQIAERLTAWRR